MLRRLFALVLPLALLGCGGTKVAPVSGTITLDGKPLPKVYVNFQPIGTANNPNPGSGSYGVTDEQGRFTLKLVENGQPGAVIGEHRVSITPQVAEDGGKVDPATGSADGTTGMPRLGKVKPLPARYNAESKLTYRVESSGTTNAEFKLDSNP